jgi:hypothetical protein
MKKYQKLPIIILIISLVILNITLVYHFKHFKEYTQTDLILVYSYSQDEEFNPDLAEQIISTTGLNYMPLNKSPKSSRQKRYYRVSVVDKFGNEGEISEATKK